MNKVLVVIDCQNDFIDGALRNEEAIKRVPNIVNYIDNFDGKYIIATMDTHFKDYLNTLEGQKLPIKHCIFGSIGWQMNENIANAIHSKNIQNNVILKNTFGSIDQLAAALKHAGEIEPIDEIVFVGFCTDICVVSNVLITRANFPNTKITVIENCCAGVTSENHEAALTVMKSCQIDIE